MRITQTDTYYQLVTEFPFPRHTGRDSDRKVKIVLVSFDKPENDKPRRKRASKLFASKCFAESALWKALLSVTSAPDNLAVSSIAWTPADSAKLLMMASELMPRLKMAVPKEEQWRVGNKNSLEGIIQGKVTTKILKQKQYIWEQAKYWRRKVCWQKKKQISTLAKMN